MRIGELADRVGLSTKAIRYYESLGLIEDPDRTPGGYRSYRETDVERLQFVRDAQSTGLTLAEIASVLELKNAGERSCAHTSALLERHLVEVDAQIERLQSSRVILAQLAERARSLDPAACTDPNRCQVIGGSTDV